MHLIKEIFKKMDRNQIKQLEDAFKESAKQALADEFSKKGLSDGDQIENIQDVTVTYKSGEVVQLSEGSNGTQHRKDFINKMKSGNKDIEKFLKAQKAYGRAYKAGFNKIILPMVEDFGYRAFHIPNMYARDSKETGIDIVLKSLGDGKPNNFEMSVFIIPEEILPGPEGNVSSKILKFAMKDSRQFNNKSLMIEFKGHLTSFTPWDSMTTTVKDTTGDHGSVGGKTEDGGFTKYLGDILASANRGIVDYTGPWKYYKQFVEDGSSVKKAKTSSLPYQINSSFEDMVNDRVSEYTEGTLDNWVVKSIISTNSADVTSSIFSEYLNLEALKQTVSSVEKQIEELNKEPNELKKRDAKKSLYQKISDILLADLRKTKDRWWNLHNFYQNGKDIPVYSIDDLSSPIGGFKQFIETGLEEWKQIQMKAQSYGATGRSLEEDVIKDLVVESTRKFLIEKKFYRKK